VRASSVSEIFDSARVTCNARLHVIGNTVRPSLVPQSRLPAVSESLADMTSISALLTIPAHNVALHWRIDRGMMNAHVLHLAE